MEKDLDRLLGEGPYPFPREFINHLTRVYLAADMVAVIPKTAITMPPGTHAHESYEFIVPFSVMPDAWAGKKRIPLKLNRLHPFNSGQTHGPVKTGRDSRFAAFMIDCTVLDEVAREIYGKTGVVFKNQSYKFSPVLRNLAGLFIEEVSFEHTGYQFNLQNIRNILIATLLRELPTNLPSGVKEKSYVERKNIKRAIEFINENYLDDFSLNEVAHIANLSPSHFIRVFKASTGKTPLEFLQELKIDRARRFLADRTLSVSEIARFSGFNSPSYFSYVFKKRLGVSPQKYREQVSW